MHHLLLPSYPDTNICSSAWKPITGKSYLPRLSEAGENRYQGSYFNSPAPLPSSFTYGTLTPYESDLHPTVSELEPVLVSDNEPQSPTTDTEVAAEKEVPSPHENARRKSRRGCLP